jgi:predicted PurR-regulated permease PerM
MSAPTSNEAEIQRLIAELAIEHGVALDRSDPILILQTATRRILSNALLEARQNLSDALVQHRSELEFAANKWQADAKRAASQLSLDVRSSISTSVAQGLSRVSGVASDQLLAALAQYRRTVRHGTVASAVSAAIAIVATVAMLWASHRVAERADACTSNRIIERGSL